MVWEKIEELLSNPEVGGELISIAQKRHDTERGGNNIRRIKMRIYDLGQQQEVLAERLTQLPKSVSPEPIYKQMEKIQALKAEKETRLREAESKRREPPATIEVYEKFLDTIRRLKDHNELGFLKAKIVKALVHRIEILPENLRIHYRVGQTRSKGGWRKPVPDSRLGPTICQDSRATLTVREFLLTLLNALPTRRQDVGSVGWAGPWMARHSRRVRRNSLGWILVREA